MPTISAAFAVHVDAVRAAAHTESLSREGGLGVANGVFDSAIAIAARVVGCAAAFGDPRACVFMFFYAAKLRGGQK